MVKNIVVPLDGSSYSWSASRHAIQVARAYRAMIHGVSVTDVKILEGSVLDDLDVGTEVAQQRYQDKGNLLLNEFESRCQEADVSYRSVHTVGIVPGAICRVAAEVEAELIVMGKRGENGAWNTPLLGSTAESVVRLARRPVLLAQEHYAPVDQVAVAYDGALISIRCLRFAADMCQTCRWPLSVISVHRSPRTREKRLREAARTAELHGLKITPIECAGNDVVQEIIDGTAEGPQALLALGARSRRLLGLTLGNTAERTMRRVPQPVLVYRPLPD